MGFEVTRKVNAFLHFQPRQVKVFLVCVVIVVELHVTYSASTCTAAAATIDCHQLVCWVFLLFIALKPLGICPIPPPSPHRSPLTVT